MIFDEFYFHWKRGLGLWEIVGHPLDTVSVLSFYVLLFFSDNNFFGNSFVYAGIFSCFLVTKDEWVHSKFCEASENWLHSILFLVHPCCFFSAWYIFKNRVTIFGILGSNLFLAQLILGTFCFLLYQIIFWWWQYEKKLPLTALEIE
jgi:hypothetical protein